MTKNHMATFPALTVAPCLCAAGITGILMSAAGLPVCLTRPPRMQLHPPPVSKSDIKPVPGLGHCCRKTTKKQARKGVSGSQTHTHNTHSDVLPLTLSVLVCPPGKSPEEVVMKYFKRARTLPDLVRQLASRNPT